MIKIDKKTKDQLLDIHKTKKISLEGNILKVIDTDGDVEFEYYIKESIEKDKDNRRKRLDITKQIQSRNTDLLKSEKENERVNRQLQKAVDEAEAQKNKAEELLLVSKQHFRNAEKKEKEQNVALQKALDDATLAHQEAYSLRLTAEKAKEKAENAKKVAIDDLELMQKKTQFELIGSIVKVALWVILGVGITTTIVYVITLFAGFKTDVIGSSWVNIMSILLTNAFSIIGTLMGMKTMSDNKEKSN
jgi:uncharacterized membrane protein